MIYTMSEPEKKTCVNESKFEETFNNKSAFPFKGVATLAPDVFKEMYDSLNFDKRILINKIMECLQ